MRDLLHHLEAGVAFMFVVTFLAVLVILEALGLGVFALTLVACFLFYLLGRVKGAEVERRAVHYYGRDNVR